MKEIPNRSFLVSEDWKSHAEGSNNRIDREIFLWYENEDVSHFEVLISERKSGNWFFPNATWRPPATKDLRLQIEEWRFKSGFNCFNKSSRWFEGFCILYWTRMKNHVRLPRSFLDRGLSRWNEVNAGNLYPPECSVGGPRY